MDSTAPKPFVFVLMPFAPEFDDIYQVGIKPACGEPRSPVAIARSNSGSDN